MKRLIVILAALAVLVSCESVPTEIPEDLGQAELIQLAQESADGENWDAAIAYYQAVLDRFPQDRAAASSAQYEIAFIYYKRGDIELARAGFEQLLGLYDFEDAALPQWPRALAERLLEQIESAEAAAEEPTAGE